MAKIKKFLLRIHRHRLMKFFKRLINIIIFLPLEFRGKGRREATRRHGPRVVARIFWRVPGTGSRWRGQAKRKFTRIFSLVNYIPNLECHIPIFHSLMGVWLTGSDLFTWKMTLKTFAGENLYQNRDYEWNKYSAAARKNDFNTVLLFLFCYVILFCYAT